MQQTIKLVASAKYGFGGKQYIARITGRDSKFTFAREFVGTKSGKRREYAEYMTDEPGLYIVCDIDRKGNKDETFVLVEREGAGLVENTCTKEEAMKLAKLLDTGNTFESAVAEIWPTKTREQELADYVTEASARDQNFVIAKPGVLAVSLGATPENGMTRGMLVAAAKAELEKIRNPAPALSSADVLAALGL